MIDSKNLKTKTKPPMKTQITRTDTKQLKLIVIVAFCMPILLQGFQFRHTHHRCSFVSQQQRNFVSPTLHASYDNNGIGSTIPTLNNSVKIGGRSVFDHVAILDDSLNKLTGRGIRERIGYSSAIDDKDEMYKEYCMNDRFVIVSHGTEDDPIYNFSNVAGLEAFVRSWDDFVVLPSRLSVVLQSKDEQMRIELMSKVTNDGFVEGATGIRVRGDDKFIQLVDAVVWNLYDADGVYSGQAAMFDREKCPIIEKLED